MIGKNSIKEFYNQVYKEGDIRDNIKLYCWIVSFIDRCASTQLLDVGCGVGYLLSEAAKKGANVFGLDISQEGLAKLKHKLPFAKVCVADGEKIPFKDNSFDYIVSLGSIEHFLHPEKGIEDIQRTLRSNGHAILLLPNSFYFGDILKVLFLGRPDKQWQIQEKLLTKEQWHSLIESNGLIVEKIYGYNKYPEFFKEGTFKIKSVKKYIKTFLIKYFCPLNLSWQFVYVCKKHAKP